MKIHYPIFLPAVGLLVGYAAGKSARVFVHCYIFATSSTDFLLIVQKGAETWFGYHASRLNHNELTPLAGHEPLQKLGTPFTYCQFFDVSYTDIKNAVKHCFKLEYGEPLWRPEPLVWPN